MVPGGVHASKKPRSTLEEESFTDGLLHDAGKLILASTLGEQYPKVLEYMEQADIGLYAAERELLGCSHAQVGAYLFGLWGLPSTIVEAVAWHHDPAGSLSAKFSPLAAVHVASAYHDGKSDRGCGTESRSMPPFWPALVARNEKRSGGRLDVDEPLEGNAPPPCGR